MRGLAAAKPPPGRLIAERSPAFARVEAHRSVGPVLEAWADLEASAPCSIYQTRAWLLPWIETLGRRAGLAPLFVLALGSDERPCALLCLGVTRRGPLRIATWLGGKDVNFNMPLIRPGTAWTRAEVTRLLRDAAHALGRDAPDVFALVNQPFAWNEQANPFALLAYRPSPSAAHATPLPRDAGTLFAKLSTETRKKLRKKEARLATLGTLIHQIAIRPADQAAVIDTFLAMKIARLRDQGIGSAFEWPEMRAFITAASAGGGIELHALRAGGRIVAVYGGAAHDGAWSGMFNAFDADETIAKSSPGDLLLMRIAAKACVDGLTRLDLGIGEARYKAALCDEVIPLFDAIVPVTPPGRLFAHLAAAIQHLKRIVKRNPRLFRLAKRIRALRR